MERVEQEKRKMTDNALEFSRYLDARFGDLANRLATGQSWRLLFQHRIDPDSFEKVRLWAAMYISACLGETKPILEEERLLQRLNERKHELVNLTPNGALYPKREHILEFNGFHKAVCDALAPFRLEELISSGFLPIRFRVADATLDLANSGRVYPISSWHIEPWVGEPADAVVIALPIFGDISNITIQFAEMPVADEGPYSRVLGNYDEARDLLTRLSPYDAALELGSMYVYDARLVHRHHRRARQGIRISADWMWRRRCEPSRAERAQAPALPEKLAGYVPFGPWSRIGRESILSFDETCEQARQRYRSGETSRQFGGHRIVSMLPEVLSA